MRPLGHGEIIHQTLPLHLTILQQQEEISFHLIQSPTFPVILGFPWLLLDLSRVPPLYHPYQEAFSKRKATTIPPHRPYDCAIDLLPGTIPPRGCIFSLSPPEWAAMDSYIEKALATGFIRPSTSPAGAGVFFVGKKDGGLRQCIYYRGLNKITVRNRYPLPLMSSAFELFQGASIFTKLDLRNAYHLVHIRQGDEWKAAFNTPEYQVMPRGLTNSPAVFQALINDVLRDMLNQFVFVYLDDILIFSGSLQEHTKHVQKVLRPLLDNHLYIKPEKCEFHVSEVQFLGFIITPGNIQMDPRKVQAVTNWPTPTNVKAFGICKFLSQVCMELQCSSSSSLSPHQRENWSSEPKEAFKELKRHFTTVPILTLPDPNKPFVVEVYGSDVGVGAILSQRGVDNKHHLCAFLSHRLSPAERNYDVGD